MKLELNNNITWVILAIVAAITLTSVVFINVSESTKQSIKTLELISQAKTCEEKVIVGSSNIAPAQLQLLIYACKAKIQIKDVQ